MKNVKKPLLLIPAVLLALLVYGFTSSEEAPPLPESSITYDQAHMDRALFLANNPEAGSDFTFDYEQMKKFMDYIEYQKAQGADVEKIRVYLSTYQNGKNSAFIAPIKKDDTPNYNIRVINMGQQGDPPGQY